MIKRYYDVVKHSNFKSFFTSFGQQSEQKKELAKLKSMSKINSIQFVYKNAAVIGLLKQRGHALINGGETKFDKVLEIENKINAYKDAHYDEMVTPVHAFIIFEHEKGHNTALKKCYSKAFTFNGKKL